MAAANCLLTEDQLLCPICLAVLTYPVTTPCGHNFCMKCITKNWDVSVTCECPVCKELFYSRPQLRVNTFISQMADQFKQEANSSSEQRGAKAGEVACDLCTGIKMKAVKSCMVCLTSYCETHLEPHLRVVSLKKHQLINPMLNLDARFCKEHNKLPELFCNDCQMCVCMVCAVIDHKDHNVIPLKEAHEGKKTKLGKTKAEILQMIQKRLLKIQEIEHSLELSNKDAEREKAGGIQVFSLLKQFLEREQKQVIKIVGDKQTKTEQLAKGLITELELEIFELTKIRAEMEQLSNSEDDLDFLQSFLSLNTTLPTKDWTKVKILPTLYEGTVRVAVETLIEQLNRSEEQLIEVIGKLSEAELKKVQLYAADVTLDADTAHTKLSLSEDGKQVKRSKKKNFKDTPERFSHWFSVLGKQSFSSGRFYFEVQVKGNNEWDLGVVRDSINKKGKAPLSPKEGYWAIGLLNQEYKVHIDSPVELSVGEPEKVGVFVDYEMGLVSFYDVGAADLIYTFTGCSFTEKLYPFFSPGIKSSSPLIITPVIHNK